MSVSEGVKHKLDDKLTIILDEIGGESCVKVSEELHKVNLTRPEITDDELAEICGIKLNIVRKILYVLYENKLSEFRKVRDKKSGWFIYYWHENFDNIKELVKFKQEQVLEKLSYRLEYENNNVFFICHNLVEKKVTPIDQKKTSKQPKIPEPDPNPIVPEKIVCKYMATFEEAMEENFRCIKCGAAMTNYDNNPVKEFLQEKIAILRQNIKNIG